MTPSVLVTDGEERSSLAAVRSLGRAGYDVGVTARRDRSLAGASRYASRTWTTPDPLAEPAAYVAALGEITRANSIDVLLPMTEASLHAVLPRRDELHGVRIPFPSYDCFRAITDKSRVAEAAWKMEIGVPKQVRLESPNAVSWEALTQLDFPLVLKPTRSIGEAGEILKKVSVTHVADREELPSALESLPPQAYPLLAQEKIVGTGAGVFLLVHGGDLVAKFAHRRIREKPPTGGVSVCRESVAADPGLVAISRALLEQFGWEGVAMVEYKIQDGSGKAYIMEVNPRLWGSLQLAIDAGVDFPRLLVEVAMERQIQPVSNYKVGVRSRWWWGEVDHLIARVNGVYGSEGVIGGVRELFEAAGDLATGWRGRTHSEIWSWTDPRPFLRETAQWLRAIATE